MKIKNKIFAISTAPAAMPPNPKRAATIAMSKKTIAQRINIIFSSSSETISLPYSANYSLYVLTKKNLHIKATDTVHIAAWEFGIEKV